MSDISERVKQITAKLSKLHANYEKVLKENEELKKENSSLRSEISQQTQKQKSLEEDLNRIKLAKTLVSTTGEKAEMKFRVNELVREIDKCIALLNR